MVGVTIWRLRPLPHTLTTAPVSNRSTLTANSEAPRSTVIMVFWRTWNAELPITKIRVELGPVASCIAGLNGLVGHQALAVDGGIAGQLHHVAAALRLCRAKTTHGRPGGGGLQKAAALKPQHFGFGAALQVVLRHSVSPGIDHVSSKQSR